MVSTRNPDTMTEPERRAEAAALLASAVRRHAEQAREAAGSADPELDLPADPRLSVAPPPTG